MTNFEWRRKIHTCEKTIWRNFTVSVRNTMWKLPKFSQSLTHFFWQKFRESNVFSFFANHLMNDNSANWQYSEVKCKIVISTGGQKGRHYYQGRFMKFHPFSRHCALISHNFVSIKCGNVTIKCYVKSILENIKVQKMLFFCNFRGLWIFNFGKFQPSENSKVKIQSL